MVLCFFWVGGLGAIVTLEDQKKIARGRAFARRKAAFREQNKKNMCNVLLEVLAQYRGAPLAGYMPINTEIDPRPAMVKSLANGEVGVPVITKPAHPLKFAKWSPESVMVAGAFKAQIPAVIHWMIPEIIILPVLAWDANGGRLGYGGGFYDRTLEGLRARGSVLAIGFAFNAQEAENLPLGAHDQTLDMIITEDRVFSVTF